MDYQRLIIRHLSGHTDPEEEQQLKEWIRASDANQHEYLELKQAWDLGGVERLPKPDQVYARIDARISEPPIFSLSKRAYLAAAMISLLLLSGYLLWIYTPFFNESKQWQLVQTQIGGQQQLRLPDGTVIYLNTESSLKFPQSFNGDERRVILNGEAFFDVARDTLKPFIIELPEGKIRVLGTSFNVKAYAKDSKMETTVSTGKVAFLYPGEQEQAALIQPNEKLSYSKTDKSISKETTEVEQSLAWMENKIVFQASTLQEIAGVLEHYFDIEVEFENEQLQVCSMTGTFSKDSYREILNTLAMTNAFGFREDGKRVILYGEGCQKTD
ncbi:FecR domain-containing protein [Catalinimonas sp. 4WD22]|uniref:FecR family protein n=1 Tax=Catalinimonas locisalis TaxID=3133978 RepID=UPI003100EB9A